MWRVLITILVIGLAACSERAPAVFRNTDISGAEFGRSLALNDHHGKARTLADFQGQAVVIFFGYTSCPDVCPTTLARYAEVMKQLGRYAGHVQVLFVTIDPERDTPEKLAAYVPWFDPSFIGLYGDTAATEAVAREFKVFYARSQSSAGMGYVIDHSAGAYVFDPAGRIRLYVKDDAPVDAIVSDLKLLLTGQ
ncbi:SCO family protein [Propionivibrio sp.]|uniref:SCO family protein n=1 Tax=Propionivibrio sp. TaxID=2212460 RepID=UPI003BF3580A